MSEHPILDGTTGPGSGGVPAGAPVASSPFSEQQALAPRDRLLDAARDLFCQHGINATGVDAIVARAGTAKTTLYKLFGSKQQLVEAFLDREGQAWRGWF